MIVITKCKNLRAFNSDNTLLTHIDSNNVDHDIKFTFDQMYKLNYEYNINEHSIWKLLKYDKDSKSNEILFNTNQSYIALLLYPDSKFNGGDIIISNDVSHTVVKSDKLTDWTLIVFPTDMSCKLEKITNGCKVMFITKVCNCKIKMNPKKSYIGDGLAY